MSLTERQRDMLLTQIDRKLDKILRLVEPDKPDPGEITRKRNPRKSPPPVV